jgi:outer membrane protein OmpA-like peptidoglycan-associated protein
MAKSYYKIIEGKKYDREVIEIAEEAAAAEADKIISVEGARKIYEAIIDGNTITQIEQETLDYLKENLSFSEEAIEWLDDEIEKWRAEKQFKETKASYPAPTPKLAPKPKSAMAPKPKEKAHSKVWPALIITLIILLPVVYFTGKQPARTAVDPSLNTRVTNLEADLQKKEQKVVTLTARTKNLQARLTEAEAKQSSIATKPMLGNNRADIREQIAEALEKSMGDAFAGSRIQFDRVKLLVTFLPDQSFFAGGGVRLKPALKKQLRDFFPDLVRALVKHDDQIAAIRIQGHASSDWKVAQGPNTAYLGNMKLSIARAEAALAFCLNLDSIAQNRDWLKKRLVTAGLSSGTPIVDASGAEDGERSRRITISIEPITGQ